MFAVKGWAVDAGSLKPQTEPFKPSKPDPDAPQKRSRKRKRQSSSPQSKEDVGELWEQHVEGKVPVKKQKKEKKQKKDKTNKKKQGLDSATGSNSSALGPRRTTSSEEAPATEQQPVETPPEKKRRRDKKRDKSSVQDQPPINSSTITAPPPPPPVPALPSSTKLTPMQTAMRQKLISARFRHLNETLYTAPSTTSLSLFAQNPEMFEDYHAGFRQQVSVWPENPVDAFIATIRSRGTVRSFSKFQKDRKMKGGGAKEGGAGMALPRTHGTCIIADLGCGDARLAQTLTASKEVSTLNLKIHSFDLHSPSPLVTKADIANVPQEDGSVDVAIFCLALMGTNWISFVEEAWRILHWKGELWVAEIKSRFGRVGKKEGNKVVEHSVGGKKKQAVAKKMSERKEKEMAEGEEAAVLRSEVDGVVEGKSAAETDVSGFVDVLRRRGFVLKEGEKSVDLGNKMFVRMEFVKAATPTKGTGMPKEGEKPVKMAKKKFIDEKEEDVATDDETKVLKPCLYKIR